MGIGTKLKQAGRSFEDESRRSAKYTFAALGGAVGGPQGAALGYNIGASFDDRKPKLQQSGTDLAKLRREAQANGFNPLTVLRATGGQGFYHQQIPMGRLSSDAFFNAFDAYQQRNSPAPQQQINDEIRLVDPILSQSIAVPKSLSKVMYRPSVLQEETVTSLLKNGSQITTDDKVKSLIGMTRDRFGKIWYHPWVEWEIDEMVTQLAGNSFFEASHWRDKALNAVKNHIKKAKNNKISRKQIRDIVNSRKISNNLHQTPPLSSAQFDNKLGIKKPIKGLTIRAREQQDRINEKMGW